MRYDPVYQTLSFYRILSFIMQENFHLRDGLHYYYYRLRGQTSLRYSFVKPIRYTDYNTSICDTTQSIPNPFLVMQGNFHLETVSATATDPEDKQGCIDA